MPTNRATLATRQTVAFILQERITSPAYLDVNDGHITRPNRDAELWIDFAVADGMIRVVLPADPAEAVEVHGFSGQPSVASGGTVHIAAWRTEFSSGTPADLVVRFIENAMVER